LDDTAFNVTVPDPHRDTSAADGAGGGERIDAIAAILLLTQLLFSAWA
jgi:hypothetical protein